MHRKSYFSFLRGTKTFLLLSAILALAACNGTGEIEEETYAGPSSSSLRSEAPDGSGISGGGGIPVDDILSFSNSGDTDEIISRLTGESGQGTTMIALSSADIGLPSGGYVTLTITGDGIAFAADSSGSSDGKVWFSIPQFASGTTITVSVIVKESDGTVVCFGSKTQTVEGDSSNISISLSSGSAGTTDDDEDDAWLLPDPPTVSATPTGVDYRHSVSPVPTVRLEVLGLTDPPSGSLSCAWTNAQGTAIGSDSKVIDVPITDIIGVAPDTLPEGDSNLTVGLVLTYTDADGNTQTSSASCPVAVTIHKIPSFELTQSTPLPVGMAVRSASSYDVSDLNQTLTVIADPASGSSFRPGTEFSWTVNGTSLLDASGNPVKTASAPIRLSDYITVASLSTTTPVQLTIACTASDSWATNSPTAPVTKTLDFYKPAFPTPVPGIPTCSGTYIGYDAATATYSFYAAAGADPSGSTSVSFSLSNDSMFPASTTYNWKLNGNSMWGPSSSSSSGTTIIGAITGFSMSAGTGSFTVVCEATDGSTTETSATVTVKILRYPSSVSDFHTYIDSYPGQQYMSGAHCYDVVDESIIGMKLSTNVSSGVELPPNGTASFEWKANGVAVKTTTTQEASLTIGEILSALGSSVSALPNHDSSMSGAPSGGLPVEISCTITVTVSGATKGSDTSASYETGRTLFLYQ